MGTLRPQSVIATLITLSIVLAGCTGMQTKPSTGATAPPSSANTSGASTQKWEYKLETINYDTVCAATATAPYASNTEVTKDLSQFGVNRYGIAWLWQSKECWGAKYPVGAVDTILREYTTCASKFFDDYAGKMGEDGWEIVNYERLQYTLSGTQYCTPKAVDFGYEVMWKRPKVGK